MHEPKLADAFRPPFFAVMGLPLLDYTLGHEIVLWQRRNPLVAYRREGFKELSEPEQIRALKQAAQICSRRLPWPMRLADAISRWLPRKMALRLQDRASRRWKIACEALDTTEEADKFFDYLDANRLDFPTVRQPRVQGSPFHYFGSPEVARLLNYVTTHQAAMVQTHFAGSPLNFPYGLARLLDQTQAETDGNLWIQNFHDWEHLQQREAFEQAHPESGFAIGDEAVQAAAEKWNAEHPDCPVPLPDRPKTKSTGDKN